ncbi:MAG: hypothetical protein UV58_C0010G0016 [Candidatus Wolfebacteria bacterium GW2011_GWC1_43_10]|uniref:GIY-YIG domain-containing protein n=1 Tax=Candidatus Wolfebacteria bacterium GW2011_GWC1_43_10 TaxID=1619011 RepID=A0A0G1EH80_9BACT|nr:MAG: hypothetical protein UV58_C0010G0016 [Candidatus Wolfebacteria bacterium GW2011_GWC1_43_10]
MRNYKNQFKLFLEKNGFLPFKHWNCFKIEHGKETIFKSNLEKIRQKVNKSSGIYIYKKGKDVLYVDKAISLFGRLKSHNRESFEPVPSDRKDGGFYKFFSARKNCGKLRVYWIEVKIEEERVVFEAMLQYLLEPDFK